MKFSLAWLSEYIDITVPPQEVEKRLTRLGLEVEDLSLLPLGFDGIVVGKVLEVEPHPMADKLCVAKVDDGQQVYQVVCGAPNCRKGLKTAFAMVGSTVTMNGKTVKIKRSKIRDVESFGMLLSEKELGLSDEHEGIIEFAEQVQEGADVAEMYGDTLIEVGLTPNLAHCQSLFGIARELNLSIKSRLKPPADIAPEEGGEVNPLNVQVEDAKACPRYTCRYVRNLKVAPSPAWLQKRLLFGGVRPVNNVVDSANYVMLELGHPLHAFDADRLSGDTLFVRRADDEVMTTLDGKELLLSSRDLVIADREKPVALAGVMGAKNSEVNEQTKNVVLEAAYFDPKVVRKMSKRHAISSDSSKRFERGVDPNGIERALNRLSSMLKSLAGGEVLKGICKVSTRDFPAKSIRLRLDRINQVLGLTLGFSEVESILQILGYPFEREGKNAFLVTSPTYRVDLHEEIDLVEEIARIYGYENIPIRPPQFCASELPDSPIYLFEEKAKERLVAEGLQEWITCDLIGPKEHALIDGKIMSSDAVVKVMNPASIEQSILRISQLPGMLSSVRENISRGNLTMQVFEAGRIHFKQKESYKEQSMASILLCGNASPHHFLEQERPFDFYDLKGIVENVFEGLRIHGHTFLPGSLTTFHPGRQAAIFVGEMEVGAMGEVHPALLREAGIEKPVMFAELNLHDLYRVRAPISKMREIPAIPGSDRDWTITVPEPLAISSLIDRVRQIPSTLLEEISLRAIYRSEALGRGVKNVTLHFVYRHPRKTVKQEAVDKEHLRIVEEVEKFLSHEDK